METGLGRCTGIPLRFDRDPEPLHLQLEVVHVHTDLPHRSLGRVARPDRGISGGLDLAPGRPGLVEILLKPIERLRLLLQIGARTPQPRSDAPMAALFVTTPSNPA